MDLKYLLESLYANRESVATILSFLCTPNISAAPLYAASSWLRTVQDVQTCAAAAAALPFGPLQPAVARIETCLPHPSLLISVFKNLWYSVLNI